MAGRVEGKVAFVTGAARGQGRSHAVRLAEEGADIIAVDVCGPISPDSQIAPSNPDDLAQTADLVKNLDRRIVTAQVDVRDYDALKAVVDSGVEQLYGRMERSLLRYTVGQTLASLVMGLSATFGMWLLGVTGIWPAGEQYAVLFGLFVAVTEFAPSIGPVIGSIPPIITAAFDGLGPAIAVALLFLALHQIEGHIVIPKLMGAAIAVHPLLVIFGILAGAQIMGIGGILLALPLLAVGREIVQFIAERISFEPWPTTEPALAGAAGSETPPPPPETRSSSIGRTLQTAIASRRRRRRDAGDGPDGSKGTS